MTLSSESYYRPTAGDFGDYVLETQSGVGYALSSLVTLKVSFHDTYDSRAVSRGADTNNEGQLLFSVLVS